MAHSKSHIANEQKTMNHTPAPYYVPHGSPWPIIGSIGLCTTVVGAVHLIHNEKTGLIIFPLGLAIIAFMMMGWFGTVIHESQQGLYSDQLDRSFRYGMAWFIFSEVMFFGAFFGALFYVREWAVPWLSGHGDKASSHLLWENFKAMWPLLDNPDPNKFPNPNAVINAFGIPALNTLILLSSGVTITIAHHALKNDNRRILILGLAATIVLGFLFLILQAYEYHHAYTELNLKLNTGIYASTFYMLTGFHGAHVTIGAIMLTIILIRCIKGHFTPERHFGFEAAAWYWHFVDVVWLMLFIFVYWL